MVPYQIRSGDAQLILFFHENIRRIYLFLFHKRMGELMNVPIYWYL